MSRKPTVAELQQIEQEFIRIYHGSIDLLHAVRAAKKLIFVVTNNIPPFFARQSAAIGLRRFVSPRRTITSFEYGVSKSSPDLVLFNAVLDAVPGLTAPQCVFIDDRLSNLERGQEVGMQTIRCDSEKAGLNEARLGLEALGVFDSRSDWFRAVVFDIGGVLAPDVWEHLYLDSENGLVARFPHLNPADLDRVGRKLWEEFAYSKDSDGRMEERYWERFLAEFSWDL